MAAWILSRVGVQGVVGIVLLAVSLTGGLVSFLLLGKQQRRLEREIEEIYF